MITDSVYLNSREELSSNELKNSPSTYKIINGFTMSYRVCGQGPALLLIHPWPLNGLTFNTLVEQLKDHFTCYVVDLPGAGNTRLSDEQDLSPKGLATLLSQLILQIGLRSYSLYGNDSGGMVARYLAVIDGDRIEKMILTNTEIPNHRGPYFQLYRYAMHIPGFNWVSRQLLKIRIYRESGMSLGGVFYDKKRLSGEFYTSFIVPLIKYPEKMNDAMLTFLNFSTLWEQVDELKTAHRNIKVPTLFIWGSDDQTFPEVLAKQMSTQFPHCEGFISIPGAKLYLHEEKTVEVANATKHFLLARGAYSSLTL